eukprot:jgi/Astpho2/4310/Aster-07401
MISSLARGCGPLSAGSRSLAAQSEPEKELQPHQGAAGAASQQATAPVVGNQESFSSLDTHRADKASGGGKQGPDSLGGSLGRHQHRLPPGPAYAVEGDERGQTDASAVVLGSWADRVTDLSLHYDSTAAAAARRMLRQRAAAARGRMAPAAPPANLRHMSPAGSVDMGQGPPFSPFAGAVEILSSSNSSATRGSPAASLPLEPNSRQAACITRRWSTGEPDCRRQSDRAVLRWRADFVRRWRQCQEQAFLQGQGVLPLTSSPASTELLNSELPAHGWSSVHGAAGQHAAVLQTLQRQVEQPEPQTAMAPNFSLASLLAVDDHTL